MNKRFVIGAMIAGAVIVLGGLGYFIYNRYSADLYTRDFCVGTTGTAWKNCTRNMASWKRYMISVDNARFQAMINNADGLRKKTSTSTPASSSTATKPTTNTGSGSTNVNNIKNITFYTTADPNVLSDKNDFVKDKACAATFTDRAGQTIVASYLGNIGSVKIIKGNSPDSCSTKVEEGVFTSSNDKTVTNKTFYLTTTSGLYSDNIADKAPDSSASICVITDMSGKTINAKYSGTTGTIKIVKGSSPGCPPNVVVETGIFTAK